VRRGGYVPGQVRIVAVVPIGTGLCFPRFLIAFLFGVDRLVPSVSGETLEIQSRAIVRAADGGFPGSGGIAGSVGMRKREHSEDVRGAKLYL